MYTPPVARLVAVKCPNCGAGIKLEPRVEVVNCVYCHRSSFVQWPGRTPAPEPRRTLPADTAVIHVQPQRSRVGVYVSLAAVMLLAGGVVFLLSGGSFGTKLGERAIMLSRSTHLVDANRDGTVDVVTWFNTFVSGGDVSTRLGVFDGRDGTELWRTEPQGDDWHEGATHVSGDLLLHGKGDGTLHALAVRTGKAQWKAALGERVETFCTGAAGKTRVRTQDGVTHEIDLASGNVSPSSEACLRRRREGPVGANWIDASEMGMAWSSDSPESQALRAAFGLGQAEYEVISKHPNFQLTSVMTRAGSPVIVLGYRAPGTSVQQVGAYAKGKLLWLSDFAPTQPLTATQGTPELVTLAPARVLIAYEQSGRFHVACLDETNGRRLWDVALAEGAEVDKLTASNRHVFATGGWKLRALALASGEQVFEIGHR